MDTETIVAMMKAEIKRLTLAVALLQPNSHKTKTKKKRNMSEAGKRAISRASKKRWAEVHKKQKAAVVKKKSPPKAA